METCGQVDADFSPTFCCHLTSQIFSLNCERRLEYVLAFLKEQ